MIELFGNMWDFDNTYIKCITTNGTITKDGRNVMGGGCAREAAERYPELPSIVGEFIQNHGNKFFPARFGGGRFSSNQPNCILIFPVKHQVWANADINLIVESCHKLMEFADTYLVISNGNYDGKTKILLPRPGCGSGGLDWKDVKPIIEPILDDRIAIIHFQED